MASTYDYEKVMQSFFDTKGGLADNYFNSTPLLDRMRSKQKKQMFVSGQPIYVPVEMAGGTGGSYLEGETFDRQRKEITHYAYYQPVNYRAELSITWGDEKRARSKEDMVGILKAKAANALKTMAKDMTTDIVSGTATDGLIGLTTAIHKGTPATFGGINPTTYTWWVNKYTDAGTAAAPTLKTIHETLIKGRDGQNGPTLIVTDKYLESYILTTLLQANERYMDGSTKHMYKLPLLYELPIVSDYALESSDDTGGAMYFIDENSYYLTVHSMDDLKRWPQVRPTNQFAFATDWTWEGAVVCNNRRRNVVMYDLAN